MNRLPDASWNGRIRKDAVVGGSPQLMRLPGVREKIRILQFGTLLATPGPPGNGQMSGQYLEKDRTENHWENRKRSCGKLWSIITSSWGCKKACAPLKLWLAHLKGGSAEASMCSPPRHQAEVGGSP